MASSAVSAVAAMPHSFGHLPIPPMPRVRPPRALPGTVSPNSAPQPTDVKPPRRKVWAQGKWRDPTSNAAKHRSQVVSAQVQKALRHQNHGLSIFAYFHVRTHQVVYSLTRILQESQVMPQLLFHGKKTVPAGIRRDHWRPYYSVHFPSTPAGARAGLVAYQRLREFAARRQLSPDLDSLRHTEETVAEWFKREDPIDLHIKMLDKKARPPKIGRVMGIGPRARKVMEQKATSVADASFVLGLAVQDIKTWTVEDLKDRTRDKLQHVLGPRGRKRLLQIREREKQKAEQIAERQKLIEKVGSGGVVALSQDAAEELALEYNGRIGRKHQLSDLSGLKTEVQSLEEYEKQLAKIEEAATDEDKVRLLNELAEIQVLWADLRDGTYAQSWPESVFHDDMAYAAQIRRHGRLGWNVHVAAADGTKPKHEMVEQLKQQADVKLKEEIASARVGELQTELEQKEKKVGVQEEELKLLVERGPEHVYITRTKDYMPRTDSQQAEYKQLTEQVSEEEALEMWRKQFAEQTYQLQVEKQEADLEKANVELEEVRARLEQAKADPEAILSRPASAAPKPTHADDPSTPTSEVVVPSSGSAASAWEGFKNTVHRVLMRK